MASGRDRVERKSSSARGSRSVTESGGGPSFDDALDTVFGAGAPGIRSSTTVTSGDEETDRAIDLAVETLFVEEPDTPAPETAQVEATVVEAAQQELAPPPAPPAKPAAEEEADAVDLVELVGLSDAEPETAPEGGQEEDDDALELVVEEDEDEAPVETPPAPEKVIEPAPAVDPADVEAIRKLQEAILTLEWEISTRSVTTLANELQKVRVKFQDNVTVEFAAMTMRLVLDYLVKRMSRAHPESIRFMLEITRFLKGSVNSLKADPLGIFHQIVSRYETYKSTVRKAEGIPDPAASGPNRFELKDPKGFSELVDAQAKTISAAARALATQIETAGDRENLIRSFRFLVTRSVNRILEKTEKQKAAKAQAKK
jgi:hypothetical protein